MQRTTTTTPARRRLALLATIPFLAFGLAACADDGPISPEGESGTTPGGGTDGGGTDGGDTDDGAGTDGGDAGNGSSVDGVGGTWDGSEMSLEEFDQGEGAPGVFTANPGECIESASADGLISCDDPHTREIYYTFNLTGDVYPGQDSIVAEVERACGEFFEPYVGTSVSDSQFEMRALFPSEDTWAQAGDTEVICTLDTVEPTEGSAFGTGQ